MRTNKFAAWAVAAVICLAGALISGSVAAATVKDAPPAAAKPDNAACLSCHDGNKLETLDANGAKRTLPEIPADKLAKSVHADMQCVACHKEITDAVASHKISPVAQKPNCIQCHETLWETVKKENLIQEKSRLGLVVKNIEAYKKSFHALPGKEDKTHPKAACDQCHDTHSFNIPARGSAKRVEWRKTVPNVCGEKCHSDEVEEYSSSVHGKALLEKNNVKSPVCIDCHSAHDIANTSAEPFKVGIAADCGSCHKDNLKSYKDTYHGQVNTLGYGYTAKCYDCHGSHSILKADDPKSKVHLNNRLKTCKQCHNGKKDLREATAGFVSYSPHANSHDFARYPEVWLTTKFMELLLIGVFTFFWTHSGLWFYREYMDRKQGKGRHVHVRTEDLAMEQGKHFRRFTWPWRLAHLLFALSVMTLVLTGMSVFYASEPWAGFIMELLGGPKVAGLIHRISAAIMLGIFFVHLVFVATFLIRNRKTFKWFGPTSLAPRWQDLWDMIGMFKWGLGLGPRPVFDRWTYWEKFDYWAVFWGMAIIGGSGALLAFPDLTAAILPGWIFNVATVVHGEEAFLAAVFLFTVHFFNNHLRPDKYPPPDIVMFTGTVSLEEFKREHWAEYSRLAESGELEKHLVDVPSRPMTLASRILGLLLLIAGFTLLALVVTGFVGSIGAG
ncbi:MAG: cytochrome C [Betaproteobacteria bacterium]|nr:cytochrome C [Betaproteobacteria bacterium]